MKTQNRKIELSVSTIGEFIRFNSCERRLKLQANRDINRALPHYERLMNSLDIVLQRNAKEKEDLWKKSLDMLGYEELPFTGQDKNRQYTTWDSIKEVLSGSPIETVKYAREVKIQASIGNFLLTGYIDFLIISWRNNAWKIRIVECKASRKIATYQHVQVAIYGILIERMLKIELFENYAIECVVARIDETTNSIQDISSLQPLDLSRQTEDIIRILAPGAQIETILNEEIDSLPFHLNYSCDNCAFNVNCFTESARLDKIEILGVTPSIVQALKRNGVNTVTDILNLDLNSNLASAIRVESGMAMSLETLLRKAKTRAKNLPHGIDFVNDSFEVSQFDSKIQSILPPYNQDGMQLIRVYMTVTTDYVEKRIVALTAHVTKSEHKIVTPIDYTLAQPLIPKVYERDMNGNLADVSGEYVKSIITKPWKKDLNRDLVMEETMIDTFFNDLYNAIKKVASVGIDGRAPVHFYFWSRLELRNLIEACTRTVDNRLLHHLRQLMGCRDGIDAEQVIYSCIQEEIRNKFALGWTGNGLSVVTSLRWFGDRYHWTREINGQVVALDELFTQDIFDFKTDLWLNNNNEWFDPELPKDIQNRREKEQEYNSMGIKKGKFEIRSRFLDTLPPPYFYAFWGELERKHGKDNREQGAISNYVRAIDYIEDYLKARNLALRWIEEKIRYKNDEIQKIPLRINELRKFELNVNSVRKSAIDYLQLDFHVKFTDWISEHFASPLNRVSEGKSLPLKDVVFHTDGHATAIINYLGFGIDLRTMLENASAFEDGSFVRISRCSSDINMGQTKNQLLYGKTCKIDSIDEDTGLVHLSVVPGRHSRYILPSMNNSDLFDYATMDSSISDFISGRVEQTLRRITEAPSYQWLTPIANEIRIPSKVNDGNKLTRLDSIINNMRLSSGLPLAEDQKSAISRCIRSKIHLLQGPPGTGKSTTTSIALLLKILYDLKPGNLIIISSSTHLAVNSILSKLDKDIDIFNGIDQLSTNPLPEISIIKLHSQVVTSEEVVHGNVVNLACSELGVRKFQRLLSRSITIVGGTVGSILKWMDQMNTSTTYSNLRADLLVIDEASMMVFPHFLALSSLVHDSADIMLAGDHRQLSPIIAHDWDNEDRPPVILYKPYVSAYQAIWDIRSNIDSTTVPLDALSISQLTRTFRLPNEVVSLIARLYKLDNIDLVAHTEHDDVITFQNVTTSIWQNIWYAPKGLYLITHNERRSKKSNLVELAIIEQLMANAGALADASTAIVTPHRAQRTLLKKNIEQFGRSIDIIETVEKLQGGERENIIVSATASDPAAIGNYSDFILNLNRANVAFSRPKKRLIVICSESLLNYIPADNKYYETAFLWKELRNYCRQHLKQEDIIINHERFNVNIYTI